MQNQSKNHKTNDDQSKYGNKMPYNNIPHSTNEELAPILVTKEMRKDKSIIKDNIETWHIHGHKIPVAFAPIKSSALSNWMQYFNAQIRVYIGSGGTSDFPKEYGHKDDLSYDKFQDDAGDDEEHAGFDPAQTASFEHTTLLGMIIDDLISQVSEIHPRYGRILDLLRQDYDKKEILTVLQQEYGIKKTQAYADIRAAQMLAKKLYDKD